MKKNIFKTKAIILCAITATLIMGMSITSFAGYVNFDVTVASNGQHPDPLSPRMTKEDGDQYFYVTPTSFSNSGEIRVFSRTVNGGATSYARALSNADIGVTKTNPYLGTAPVGQACCLESYWGGSAATNTLRVTGRYTP